jgi:WD40 repeat protein
LTILAAGGHIAAVWGIAASPDGRWFATASHDQTVKLWDAQTRRLVRTLTGHKAPVWCVAFSPDSQALASGAEEVTVWEVATGRVVHHFQGHTALVKALAFHPKQPWLVSSANDGSVRLWDLAAGNGLGVLHQCGQVVENLVFRPDGRWLAAAGGNDRRVLLWEFAQRPSLPTPPDRTLAGHTTAVWGVGFSADGRYLASGSDPGLIVLWDGQSFDRVVTLRGGTKQIRSLSFSNDSRLLAGAAHGGPTIVWDDRRLHPTRPALLAHTVGAREKVHEAVAAVDIRDRGQMRGPVEAVQIYGPAGQDRLPGLTQAISIDVFELLAGERT